MNHIKRNQLYDSVWNSIYEGKWDEAENLLEERMEDRPECGYLREGLYLSGKIKSFRGDFSGASEQFLRIINAAGQTEDPATLWIRALSFCELAFLSIKLQQLPKAGGYLRKTEEILDHSSFFDVRALHLHYRGILRYRLNNIKGGFEDLKRALKIYGENGLDENIAHVNDTLGQFHFEKGLLEDAIYYFEESLRLKQKIGDNYGLAITWGNLGRAYLSLTDYDKALSYFEKDYDFCKKSGDFFGQMIMLNNLGRTHLLRGDTIKGPAQLEKSLEMASSIGNISWILLNRKDLAKVMLECEKDDKAMRELQAILPDIRRLGNMRLEAEVVFLESRYFQKRENWEEALRKSKEALLSFQEIDLPYELILTKMQIGTIYFEAGEKEKALAIFEEALEHAESLRAPWMIVKFEELIREVGEKEWIKIRLRRYLGKAVADELLTGAEKTALGGKRQKVTVLVSDIRGYTRFSEDKKPEEIVAMLNDYFSMMVEVIHSTRGTIDKFIGDSIMAYFGAPVTYGDDSERALKAALGMMRALAKYNRLRLQREEEPVEMGIGIDTGEVIVGNIGSYQRKDYTVVGKAVSEASRLCASAAGGQILIGDATFEENKSGILKGRVRDFLTGDSKAYELIPDQEE